MTPVTRIIAALTAIGISTIVVGSLMAEAGYDETSSLIYGALSGLAGCALHEWWKYRTR